jgi:hypothetical protein
MDKEEEQVPNGDNQSSLGSASSSIVNAMSQLEKRSVDVPIPNDQVQSPAGNAVAVGSPPNGGLTAWLMVLAGFFTLFNSWGTVNSFGAFQDFYEANLLKG